MGLGNALMPVAVKERFSDRPGFTTGVYTMGITAGATIAAAIAVPLAHAAGGWRTPLLIISAVSAALAAAWLWLTRARYRARAHRPSPAEAPVAQPARLAARRGVLSHVVRLLRAQLVAARRLRRARLEPELGRRAARGAERRLDPGRLLRRVGGRSCRHAARLAHRLGGAADARRSSASCCCRARAGSGRCCSGCRSARSSR